MRTQSFIVARPDAGRSALDWLRRRLSLGRGAALELLRSGRVRLAGAVCQDPQRRLQPGERVEVRLPAEQAAGPQPSRTTPRPVVVFADAQLAVVDKPPGLTTMRHADEEAEFGARARRYLPPTLADLLPPLLDSGRPRPVFAVHRLDKDTSGLVVFARSKQAESNLGQQFREHGIERLYLALVRGRAESRRIESWLVHDRGDGRRGSSGEAGVGQHAVTHVRLVEDLGGFSLVECRLETGRTHQVRIHLGEAGWPLCGERLYDRPPHGAPLPDDSGAARTALHAATLGADHPVSGERLRWEAPLPSDMADLLKRLRRRVSDASQKRPGSDASAKRR
jgi:23S rRNA pseudouridine1911/1915/1917 synthase